MKILKTPTSFVKVTGPEQNESFIYYDTLFSHIMEFEFHNM